MTDEKYLSRFLEGGDDDAAGGGEEVAAVGHTKAYMANFFEDEPSPQGDGESEEAEEGSEQDEDDDTGKATSSQPASDPAGDSGSPTTATPTTTTAASEASGGAAGAAAAGAAAGGTSSASGAHGRARGGSEEDSHEEDFELRPEDIENLSSDDSSGQLLEDELKMQLGAAEAGGHKAAQGALAKMDQAQAERFNAQGATILAALSGGRGAQSKYAVQADSSSEEEALGTRPEYMVNPMLYGGAEDVVDYAAIFGRDLEWFPDGLRVWQVQKFMPEKIPFHHYGRFYSKETYLVLNIASGGGGRGGGGGGGGDKIVDVHMWVGDHTSMDKSGGAAFRISELCGWLAAMSKVNEVPARIKQHREEMGLESEQLRSYFRKFGGLSVSEGGTDSGFKHVAVQRYRPRLYRVRHSGHSHQCKLDVWELNRRETFLLDTGDIVYVFKGAKSSYFDRFKAVDLAGRIVNKDRLGRAKVVTVEDCEDEVKHPTTDFWRVFGVNRPPKRITDKPPEQWSPTYRVYQTQNVAGKFDLVELTERPLVRSMLNPEHCIILDCFVTIYNWKGKATTPLEKAASDLLASKFLDEMANRPKWARIQPVLQSAEPIFFREKFADWQDLEPAAEDPEASVAMAVAPLVIDVNTLLDAPPYNPEPLDDGTGQADVWCIIDNGPKFGKLNAEEKGLFYDACCYMIMYSYTEIIDHEEQHKYMVYFWQGREAAEIWYPSFLFGFYPTLKQKMQSLGRHMEQQRVHQGSEPEHFMSVFNNGIVIRRGTRPEAGQDAVLNPPEPVLLDMRQQLPSSTTRAIEVPLASAYLHSGATFVLLTSEAMVLWFGGATRCTPSHQGTKAITGILQGKREMIVQMEDDETPDFWELLGGQGPYHKCQRSTFMPRLFRCAHVEGALEVEEIINYSQSDLSQQACYLLDAENTVYLWRGNLTSESLRTNALQLANEFVRKAAARRMHFVPLEACESGAEPLAMRALFHTWNEDRKMARIDATEAKHRARYVRFKVLRYYERRHEERTERMLKLAKLRRTANQAIRAENQAIRAENAKAIKANQRVTRTKVDEAEVLKRRADREARRAAKQAEHEAEMAAMEADRKRRQEERAARRARMGLDDA